MSASPLWTGLVCRGCCCGTARKHPEIDHGAQIEALRRALGARLRVTDCLGPCDRSNVVVLRARAPSGETRTTWLGGVLAPASTEALSAFLAARPPLSARLPGALAAAAFEPDDAAAGRCRAALEDVLAGV
jgi:hypothetical protein